MIQYIDRELAVWEDSMRGELPMWFATNTNHTIRDILLDRDHSFTTLQYKHYIDTGVCLPLLPERGSGK